MRIYGEDKGFLSEDAVETISTGTELQLYQMINGLGGFIWRMNHDLADGRIESSEGLSKDLSEAQYSIAFAVANTRRFGVELEISENGEPLKKTDSYTRWFSWWDDYIQHTLSDEDYEELDHLMSTNGDYSKFRPSGDWKSLE